MSTTRQFTVFTGTFCLVGVGLLACAAFLVSRTATFIHTATATSGCVVGLEWRNGAGRSGGYVTVFTFSDNSGQKHTVRSSGALNPAPFPVGAVVTVLFQPAAPEDARIQSFRMLWFVPMVVSILGCAFAGIGAFLFLVNRKADREAGP
jgi:hypothetical protein